MAFLLVTVHVDALTAGAQSRFTVTVLLFVAVSDDMFSSLDVEVLILTWNLSLIFYFAHTCSLIIATI